MANLQRDENGRFPSGVSGNPAGRAKGTRNWLTLERLEFERVLRQYVSKEANAEKLLAGIDRVLDIAVSAEKDKDAISAMKLMLDRVMPAMPPKLEEEAEQRDKRLTIIIQTNPNATAAVEAIDAEFTEIEDDHA